MTKLPESRTALITGGSRGVGRAVCRLLASEYVDTLFIHYHQNDEAFQELAAELAPTGVRISPLRYNLVHVEEVRDMAAELRRLTSRLDYMVHCAAITAFKPLIQVKANQWDLTLQVSTRSFLGIMQYVLPLMMQGGAVVAVSSTGSQRFNMNYGALGVAKSALETTVRYLAVELANKGIRVNGVIAGLLDQEHLPPFPDIDILINETLKRTPAGRLGTAEDVAKAVIFLLTQAPWVYGQHLIVDGGFCLT